MKNIKSTVCRTGLRMISLVWTSHPKFSTRVLFLLGAAFSALLFLSSCQEREKNSSNAAHANEYFTCSMHPQVHEAHAGNCPICGMKLIAVAKAAPGATTMSGIELSPEQIRLGNIQVDTIGKHGIGNQTVLTGILNFNQEKLFSVSARVEGRVERLYFKNTGDYVAKGAKLYDLYSEQLNNAKQEYVNAVEQQSTIGSAIINYAALVESAKNKLLLWGMSETAVKQLAQNKKASPVTSFYSTEAGFITTVGINEGEYVMEGGSILQLANMSTLWAEAQVYTTQMASVSLHQNVTVEIPDLNLTENGTVAFINPEIDPASRINLIRVTVANKNNQLHPGMPVYIKVNNKQRNSVTVPTDAVLRDGNGATVWIQTKPGVYKIQMVKTGIISNGAVEITSGLRAGDVVVTSGAYLVNSEYIFKNGADPMAGMDMGNMKM